MMGMSRFRHGEIAEQAARELTDVISKKLVSANDDTFAIAA